MSILTEKRNLILKYKFLKIIPTHHSLDFRRLKMARKKAKANKANAKNTASGNKKQSKKGLSLAT